MDRLPLSLAPGCKVLRRSNDQTLFILPHYTLQLCGIEVCQAIDAVVQSVGAKEVGVDGCSNGIEWTLLIEATTKYLVQAGVLIPGHKGESNDSASLKAFLDIRLAPERKLLRPKMGAVLLHISGTSAHVPQEVSGIFDTVNDRAELCSKLTESGAELLAVWGLPYRSDSAKELNDVLYKAGRPYIFGTAEGQVIRMGPLVYPGESACLECVVRRYLAGSEAVEDFAWGLHSQGLELPAGSWAPFAPFESLGFTWFLMECLAVITGAGYGPIGRVREFTFGLGVADHEIVPAPACQTCFPAVAPRRAWGKSMIAPAVKTGSWK